MTIFLEISDRLILQNYLKRILKRLIIVKKKIL